MNINAQLVKLTLNYLSTRPYNEVIGLLKQWEEALAQKPDKEDEENGDQE